MKLNKLAALSAIALAVFGCAKRAPDEAFKTSTALNILTSVTQLPVPDNSYAKEPATNQAIGTNIKELNSLIDTVALPLKESHSKLDQVIREGQRKEGIHVFLSSVNAELKGTKNETTQEITWNYTLGGPIYMTGLSKAGDAPKGDLVFPASSLASEIKLNYKFEFDRSGDLTKTVIVKQGSTLGLTFVSKYPKNSATATSVELAGSLAGNEIKGKWDATGGSFKSGSNDQKCWDKDLTNSSCPSTL